MNIIKLKCKECENVSCPMAKSFIPEESEEGCARSISEDLYLQAYHLLKEVAPFMYMDTKKEYQDSIYNQIIDTLYSIYDAPIAHKINPQGKFSSPCNKA